jgi:hypothetical protein
MRQASFDVVDAAPLRCFFLLVGAAGEMVREVR